MLPAPFDTALTSFLLVLTSLFSIVNPIGASLIFAQVNAGRSHDDRVELAKRVGLYSAQIMLVAFWAGTPILNFFGVSLAALRIAGGLVVAASAWTMLNAAEAREARKSAEVATERGRENFSEIAFFPMTLPFTTGPGTIAVAVALGANRPLPTPERLGFYAGSTLAMIVMAVGIFLIYASSDRVVALIGPVGARVLGRLFAFLLLCIGTQITLNGVIDVLGPMLAAKSG